jgi:photosystem II stability/assembly factor-like uncharacterized protein
LRRLYAFLVPLAGVCLYAVGSAQSTIPAPPDHEMHPVWGGQNQTVHVADTLAGRRIIVGTGGGGIRVSFASGAPGSWFYADTPDDFTHTLIDLEFLDDDVGFACGRGGQILQTLDGGLTWTNYGNPVLDPCDDPGTIWSIHPFNQNVMVAVGLWSARYTANGGADWHPLELHGFHTTGATNEYDGSPLIENDFHFYSVGIVGGLGQFRGAIAAEWKRPDEPSSGVVFFSDGSDPDSGFGRRWQMVLDDGDAAVPKMVEPWALDFERGASPMDATGYVVGGEGANSPGRIYSTVNGGKDWCCEVDISPSPYGVSVEVGKVVVTGYSGVFWTNDGSGWREGLLPGPPAGTVTPGATTAAINVVDSADPSHFVIGGGFGLNLQSTDGATSWFEASPYYNLDLEEQRLHGLVAVESSPGTAFAVGQLGHVMKTTNDGIDWSWTKVTLGESLWSIEDRDGSNLITVGNASNIAYTVDGGATWAPGVLVNSNSSIKLRDVCMLGQREAFAVGYDRDAAEGAVLYTRSFGQVWFRLPLSPSTNLSGVRLEGVVFPEANRGFAVGYSIASDGTATAKAYELTFNPLNGKLDFADHSPPHPPFNNETSNPVSRKLLRIATFGTSLESVVAYAVGNGGMVLQWDGSTFVDVPAVYDLDAAGFVVSRELATDLECVDISPSGGKVLIGAQYDQKMRNAADLGWMLKFDGSWSRIRAMTGKSLVAISLTDDNLGFVAGQSHKNESEGKGERIPGCQYDDDDVEATSFDNPNLADSVILKYIDD